jgi:hypothetical protein
MVQHLLAPAPDHVSGMRLPPVMLARSALRFAVARDEEYVHLRLLSGYGDVDLGDRLHNFLLLTLARERRADAERGLPETSCGWLYADRVADELDMSLACLNLYVFRARGVLASRGVVDPAGLVERRRSVGQLRIGVGRLEVVQL